MNLPLIEQKVEAATGPLPVGGMASSLERRRLRFYLGQIVGDIAALLVAFGVAVRGLRGATDQEADLTSRLQADLEYISGWTIWRDLRILAATTQVLVHDRAF
jgi:hypothetical protein